MAISPDSTNLIVPEAVNTRKSGQNTAALCILTTLVFWGVSHKKYF
jgi:hypothetical protein